MKIDRYFRTKSFPLACFLFAKDQQISSVQETNNPKVKEFAFISTPYLEELVDKFKFAPVDDLDVMLDARKHDTARKTLLDLLNN